METTTNHEADLSLRLYRQTSLGQKKVCMCSKVRIAGGEVFEVNGKGDQLLISPPRKVIGLGRREITLLERLHCIISVLNAKPDWSASEWKSVVDVALTGFVDGFNLNIGPDCIEE